MNLINLNIVRVGGGDPSPFCRSAHIMTWCLQTVSLGHWNNWAYLLLSGFFRRRVWFVVRHALYFICLAGQILTKLRAYHLKGVSFMTCNSVGLNFRYKVSTRSKQNLLFLWFLYLHIYIYILFIILYDSVKTKLLFSNQLF